MKTKLLYSVLLAGCGLSSGVLAQTAAVPLAPWFDSNGFYNKAGVDLTRAQTDLTTCRIEALRVKSVRTAKTAVPGNVMAFTPDGKYDPVASGVGAGLANIVFAIQDASYADSIEQKEFRDCMVSLDYRKFTLNESGRRKADATEDHGFAALISAATPSDGKPYSGPLYDNYYLPELAPKAFVNGTLAEAVAGGETAYVPQPAPAHAPKLPEQGPYGMRFDIPGDIQPIAPGGLAVPAADMAIVVVSARESGNALGEWFIRLGFKRVSADGQFLDLLKDDAHFSAASFVDGRGTKDETFKGDITKPRYSTFVIPAGRYVLKTAGPINACLGTLTFEVRSGDVAYLGDMAFRVAGLPMAPVLNPFANIKKSIDTDLKESDRLAIGDDLEGARQALKADDAAKALLKPVAWQNGYRIPCDGRYIGRLRNAAWSDFNLAQAENFNTTLTEKVAEATAATSPAR